MVDFILKPINILVIIGIAFFTAASVYLFCRNGLSEEVGFKIIGSILIGLITFFISFYLSLSPDSYHKVFPSYIIVNNVNFLPVPFPVQEVNQHAKIRATELSQISSRLQLNQTLIEKIPKNSEEARSFLVSLLMHRFIIDISDLGQRDYYRFEDNRSMKVVVRDPEKRPSDMVAVSFEQLKKQLPQDYFLDNQQEKILFNEGLKLPVDTVIELDSSNLTDQQNPSETLILRKDNFFIVKITIKYIMVSKLGVYPEGFTDYGAEFFRPDHFTYTFLITMDASFDRITSKNPKTDEYKEWIKWLFDSIDAYHNIQK